MEIDYDTPLKDLIPVNCLAVFLAHFSFYHTSILDKHLMVYCSPSNCLSFQMWYINDNFVLYIYVCLHGRKLFLIFGCFLIFFILRYGTLHGEKKGMCVVCASMKLFIFYSSAFLEFSRRKIIHYL